MNTLKSTQGNTLITVVIVAIVAAILILLGLVFWNNTHPTNKNQSATTADTSDPREPYPVDDTPGPSVEQVGSISGEIRYPIEWISRSDRDKGIVFPSDLVVCAIEPSLKREVACDKGFTESNDSYSFKLTPGKYLIQAKTGTITAYYDQYVSENPDNEPFDPCSEEVSKPIVITLRSGQHIKDIHAADFWVGHLGC